MGVAWAKGMQQTTEVRNTKMFAPHTFGKGLHQQPLRNLCIVPVRNILQYIFGVIFGCTVGALKLKCLWKHIKNTPFLLPQAFHDQKTISNIDF